jgi:D-cysteine desulfhydrase
MGSKAVLPLFEHYPVLQEKLAFRPLVTRPTPVERLDLDGWLACDSVWHKRDDRANALYGGNKVRRYEFLLAEALEKGAKHIVTVGGLASTQVMATALFGREVGLPVTVVMFDQPHTSFMREALLVDAAAGATMIRGYGYGGTAVRALALMFRTRKPYFIPPGASHPLANIGYLDAMFELDAQVRAGELPRPDVMVLPAGSSGTLAALAIGCALLGWPTRVVGVRITKRAVTNRFSVHMVASGTWRYLRRMVPELASRPMPKLNFELYGDAVGEGYGYATPEAIAALPLVQNAIGARGEITYSAKALVGLRAVARRGENVLLWETLSSVRPDVSGLNPRELLPKSFWPLFDGEVEC